MPITKDMYEKARRLRINVDSCMSDSTEIYAMFKDMQVDTSNIEKPISGPHLRTLQQYIHAAMNIVFIVHGTKLTVGYYNEGGAIVVLKCQAPASRVVHGNSLNGLGGKAKRPEGGTVDKRKLTASSLTGDTKTHALDLDEANLSMRRRETQEAMLTLFRIILIQYCLFRARTSDFMTSQYNSLVKNAQGEDTYKNMIALSNEENALDNNAKREILKAKALAAAPYLEIYIFKTFLKSIFRPFEDDDHKASGYFDVQYKIKTDEKGLLVLDDQKKPVFELDEKGNKIIVPVSSFKVARPDFFEAKEEVPKIDPRILDIVNNPSKYSEDELNWAKEVVAVQGPEAKGVRRYFSPLKVNKQGSKEEFPVFGPFCGRGTTACFRFFPGFFSESEKLFGMTLFLESVTLFDIHNDSSGDDEDTGYRNSGENDDDDDDHAPSKKRQAKGAAKKPDPEVEEDEEDTGYNAVDTEHKDKKVKHG